MAAPKTRLPQERAHLLAQIAAHYLAGETQTAIAVALDISQQQVSYYLPRLFGEWRSQAGAIMSAVVQQQLAKIDLLEREALLAWERSQRKAVKRVEQVGGLDGGKVVTTHDDQSGDPRFLERVGWCIEQRLKIAGGYAQPGESTATVIIKAYSGLDVEQV